MSGLDLDKRLAMLHPGSPAGEELPSDLERLLAEDAGRPTKVLHPAWVRSLVPLLVAVAASLTMFIRHDLRAEHAWLLWVPALMRVGFGSFFMWLALRSGVPGSEPSRRVLTLSLIVGLTMVVVAAFLGDMYAAIHAADTAGPRCSVSLFGVSVAPLAFVFWLLMRAAVFQPFLSGAVGGLGVALIADAFLGLTCPVTGIMHTLVYHTGGALLFALLSGALAHVLRRTLFRQTQR